MSRLGIALGLAALFTSGCVPVVEPVGEIDKAEPDKKLIGSWAVTARGGLTTIVSADEIIIDAPVVKGNPKGLMRITGVGDDDVWFFPVVRDKHTYANLILTAKSGDPAAELARIGKFAAWQKQEEKRFYVVRYALDGDVLSVNAGNHETFAKLMTDAGVRSDGGKHLPFFLTEPKWADKHFAKGAADTVYDKMNVMTLKRKK